MKHLITILLIFVVFNGIGLLIVWEYEIVTGVKLTEGYAWFTLAVSAATGIVFAGAYLMSLHND